MEALETSNLLLLIAYTGSTLGMLSLLAPFGRINPAFWYLVFMWVIAAGTIAMSNLRVAADQLYVVLLFLAPTMFLAGFIAYATIVPLRGAYLGFREKPVESDPRSFVLVVVFISGVAVIVTFLYYQMVGYNLFWLILSGTDLWTDFSSLRLAAYSGDDYFAPGYVNQFKNTLLPICVACFVVWIWITGRRRTAIVVLLIWTPMLFLALMGTGQRAFIVLSFLSVLYGLSLVFRLKLRNLVVPSLLVVIAFTFVTYYYKQHQGFDSAVQASVTSVLKRVFVTQPESGHFAFRYIYELDVVWFGEWWQGMKGLLPYVPGSRLAHDLHQAKYGSDRGTVPPSLVGSTYHNGGVFGVMAFFAGLGMVYGMLYYRLLKGRRSVARCVGYGALFFYLSIFVAGAPTSFVNYGGVTVLLFLFLRKLRFTVRASGHVATD